MRSRACREIKQIVEGIIQGEVRPSLFVGFPSYMLCMQLQWQAASARESFHAVAELCTIRSSC